MRLLLWLQGLWCLCWLVFAMFGAGRMPVGAALSFWVITLLYCAATLGVAMKSRVSWLLSFIPPLAVLGFMGPRILANLIAFVVDDPIYVDSPGTIMIVAVMTLIWLVPAIALILALLRIRLQIWSRGIASC